MTAPSQPAGIVSRGLAVLVDLVTVVVLTVLVYLAVVLTRLIVRPRTFRWPDFSLFLSLTGCIVISIVYLTFWWGTSGRTVGGALLGLRVVTTRSALRWPVALLRAVFCTIFPIGLLWVIFDPRRRRSLQDIALRTRVVYDRPAG